MNRRRFYNAESRFRPAARSLILDLRDMLLFRFIYNVLFLSNAECRTVVHNCSEVRIRLSQFRAGLKSPHAKAQDNSQPTRPHHLDVETFSGTNSTGTAMNSKQSVNPETRKSRSQSKRLKMRAGVFKKAHASLSATIQPLETGRKNRCEIFEQSPIGHHQPNPPPPAGRL